MTWPDEEVDKRDVHHEGIVGRCCQVNVVELDAMHEEHVRVATQPRV